MEGDDENKKELSRDFIKQTAIYVLISLNGVFF